MNVIAGSEEAARRLERAGYTVTGILSRPAARRAPMPAAARQAAARAEISPHVMNTIIAADLGRRHERDPYRLAASLGLPVYRVPAHTLQNASRPGIEIRGRLLALPNGEFIQISDALRRWDELFTVAHECGHHLLGADASEPDCNDFARRFLQAELEPTPRERWAKWQRQQLEAQRRRAAALAGTGRR